MSGNRVRAFGVLVPAHRDGPAARTLARDLLDAADTVILPVSLVLADNGGNDGWGGGLPDDPRLRVVPVPQRGPGHARTAAAQALVEQWRTGGDDLAACWIISLDADTRVPPDFFARWLSVIEGSGADVLSGPSFFAPVEGGYEVPADADAASGALWGLTGFCEHFVGLVNVGGCNHAVRASVCEANDYYLQPWQRVDGQPAIVPGDDWDFGLRARLRGFQVQRANEPVVLTSARRIAADPAGFIAGRAYEKPFERVEAPEHSVGWPPAEDWASMADNGRARIVAHFLLKAALAGLPVSPGLRWFLGDRLWEELDAAPKLLPPGPGGDWVAYRTRLVARLFEPSTFELARHIGWRLVGAPTS